ncbi:MAG: sulfite oxidase [Methyloceanibacter sp.]|uniref:sulfite oxidase n=1 Tax=Methyloceanibacter sp. TaxID=1965321 RepID=UPI003C4B22E5
MPTIQKGMFAYFAEDPEAADKAVFDRESYPDRRGFLRGAGLATMGALLGAAIPFHRNMPAGLIPAALADAELLKGKEGLVLLNDRPINAETPPHLLDSPITTNEHFFVRNNGGIPANTDTDGWELMIDGLVDNPLKLSIANLKEQFEVVKLALVIECAGNGRFFFSPPPGGNQWTYGGVGCAYFTGVRLRDVLNKAGVKKEVVYTANVGADPHLSGDPHRLPISRGLNIEKAMAEDVLLAFEMNDTEIPVLNGRPLRLVVSGWPGSCSQKWLTRIWLRDVVHDGPKMGGTSYRVPRYPVAPGQDVPLEDFEIIERLPVKSLITNPATKSNVSGKSVEVRGHAWSGDRTIKSVDVSIDFGASWTTADLAAPVNFGAWQNWKKTVAFPQAGYYEIWSRATDSEGATQPSAIPWNPKGYLNNAIHRLAVNVA